MGEGTTNQDYRWRWLSTIFSLAYGLGFPAWMALTAAFEVPYPPGTLMGVLVLVWGGTVMYIVGPENIQAFKELRGK